MFDIPGDHRAEFSSSERPGQTITAWDFLGNKYEVEVKSDEASETGRKQILARYPNTWPEVNLCSD
jgi:hypothetical protein